MVHTFYTTPMYVYICAGIILHNPYTFCYYRAITLDDVPLLLRTVWLDFTLYRVYGETQQLRNGLLETLHFDHLVGASPDMIRCLLVSGAVPPLSAASLQDMMKIQYSLPGSNLRQSEEAVTLNWFNFLQECERKCYVHALGAYTMIFMLSWDVYPFLQITLSPLGSPWVMYWLLSLVLEMFLQ